MSDQINDIIQRLSRQGVYYLRIYDGTRIKGRKNGRWIAKAIRNRSNGETISFQVNVDGEPVDAFVILENAINEEAVQYLARIESGDKSS